MPERSAEVRLLMGAAVAGLVHAGFSLYWALGGRWLLPTVDQWALDYARESPVAAGFLLIIVAAVKCAVAIFPVLAGQGKLARPRAWRGLAWLAAIVLTGYGAVNSIVAWLVLGGVLRPEGGYDRQSMIGHAYLWDLLFLVWASSLAQVYLPVAVTGASSRGRAGKGALCGMNRASRLLVRCGHLRYARATRRRPAWTGCAT